MRSAGFRRYAVTSVGVKTAARGVMAGLLMFILVVAYGGLGVSSRAEASHNTCSLIAQVPGGQTAVEAWALVSLNGKLPMTFSGKVTVGHVPVTHDPIKVNVAQRSRNLRRM